MAYTRQSIAGGALLCMLMACQPSGPTWWKGNTHTHTLWSDGDAAPEHVVDWYVSHGYHFLVLSDHNVLSDHDRWFPVSESQGSRLRAADVESLEARFGSGWVVERRDGDGREMKLKTLTELRATFERDDFIFIQGEEITDRYEHHEIHVNGLNLGTVIPPQGGDSIVETIQRNIDAIIAQGERLNRPVLGHLNHPNFGRSLRPEHVAAIRGERFFEVYNGHRSTLGHGDLKTTATEQIWDVALTIRLTEHGLGLLCGLATDDAHNHHGTRDVSVPGRGWVWVRCDRLGTDAIIDAMRVGDFYASTGVRLADFGADAQHLWLQIVPRPGVTYTTEFIGTRAVDGTPSMSGQLLATSQSLRPSYRMTGDELYVRARVISSRLHPDPFAAGDLETAWVQPVLGPAAGRSMALARKKPLP
ncbi:MAG: hypothetical protein V3S08_09025 [Phycisphaerales bacterium]